MNPFAPFQQKRPIAANKHWIETQLSANYEVVMSDSVMFHVKIRFC